MRVEEGGGSCSKKVQKWVISGVGDGRREGGGSEAYDGSKRAWRRRCRSRGKKMRRVGSSADGEDAVQRRGRGSVVERE